jgi:hypothetical protein
MARYGQTIASGNKGMKIITQAIFLILTMGLLWVIFNQFVFTNMPTSWTDSMVDSPVFGSALMYGFNSLMMPAILVGIGLVAIIAMTGRGG